MVGARFRWNKAKSRRRLLLIRAWGGERFGAAGVDAGCGSVYGAVAPSCALALRSSGGAGFHVRLTPQCRGAVGCGSVCGVAAAGTANAVGGALP